MGLFDFFKTKTEQTKTEPDLTTEQIIRALIDDIPEHYRTHRQFINCIEYLEQGEWALSHDSLIELADESEHFFSDDFWLGLADAATKMNLNEKADYCREQLRITKSKISWTIPKSSTVEKIDETHYQHYYSQKLKDSWDNKRREQDKLKSFINKEGFHLSKGGRNGTLYYIANGKVCEIYWEISGVPQFNILLYFESLDSWALPTKQKMTSDEKEKIKSELLDWLTEKNISAEL